MSIFSKQTVKYAARWIIVYSVLVGLLCSSGEGIRLFPFPPLHISPSSEAPEFRTESPDRDGVDTSKNSDGAYQSKFSTGSFGHLSGNCRPGVPLPATAWLRPDPSLNFESKVIRSSGPLQAVGGRAPPVLEDLIINEQTD